MQQLLALFRSISVEHRRVLSHELPAVHQTLKATMSEDPADHVYSMVLADIDRWFAQGKQHLLPSAKGNNDADLS